MTARPQTIVTALKDFGLDVRPYPFDSRPWFDFTTAGGWDPQGITHHHTGGSGQLLVPGMNDSKRAMLRLLRIGRTGSNPLDGPLCHLAPAFMERGKRTVYLIGYGNTNHAGMGGANVAAAIRAGIYAGARPTSDAVDGNRMLYGLEYLHPGTSAPWPDELLDAGHRAAAALCQAEGWTRTHWAGSNCEHREWTTRKVDRSWSGWGDGMRERIEVLSKPPAPKTLPRARVRMVMSAQRFDRPASWMLAAVKVYLSKHGMVLLTEVANDARVAPLKLLPGITFVQVEPGNRSECAALVKRWRWAVSAKNAYRLTDAKSSNLGTILPFALGVVFTHQRTGQTLGVLLGHLPRGVENADGTGFRTDATGDHNVPAWKESVDREAEIIARWRKDPEIDHVQVWNDWNFSWRSAFIRRYLRERFPNMENNWDGGRLPEEGGTHARNRIIEYGFADFDWTASELMPDDRSSDHRPVSAVGLLRAVVRKVVRHVKVRP